MDKQQQTQPNPVYLAQLDWIEKHPKSKPLPVKGVEENNRELLVPMCSIPKGYENFQINSDGTFYLSLMHTWSMMLSEEESGRESTSSLHFHGIGKDVMKEIPGLLDDPEIIMASEPKQQTETQLPRIACVLDKERTVTNKETGKTEIETLVAFIEPPLNPRNKMSVIVSAYPMAEVEKFIEKADKRNEILYEKEKTLRRGRQGIPNAKAATVSFMGSFDDLNIQRFKDNVNIKRMNFSGLYLRDIPEEERTLKVCNAALRQNPCAIEYLPENQKTVEKYRDVLESLNKDAIPLIPNEKFADAYKLFVETTKGSFKNRPEILYTTINSRLSESQQAILKTMFSDDGKELSENEIIENIAKIIKERNSPSIQMDVRPMQNKTEENKMQKQNYYTNLKGFVANSGGSLGRVEIAVDRENGTIDVEHNGEQPIMPGAEMNWNGFSLVDFERQDEDTRYHKYTAELNEQTAAFAEEIRKKALDNIGPEDYEATTEYAENETLSKAGWAWTRHQDGSGGFHNAKNPSPYNIYYDATTNEGWLKDAVRNETDFFYRTGYDDEGVEVFDLEKFKAAAEEKIASLLNINIEQENIMEKQNKQTPVQKAATNFVLDKLAQAGIEVITDKAEMREILNSGKLVQKMAAYHGTSHEGEIDNAFNGFGTYVVSVNNDVAKEQGKKIASKKYGDAFYIKSNGQEQTLEKFLSEHGYSQYWNELLKERNFDDVNKLQHEIMMRDIKGNAELEEQKTNLSVLLSAGVIEYKREKTYLYSIDIPDNNGSNYLSYESESGIEIAAAEKINAALEKIGTAWRVDRKQNGRDVYFNTLSEKVFNGNQEQASKFLKNVGFVGMTMNSANYIIFDEKDIVVNKRVQYMMDENGEVYGFTQDGKIYLDPDLMNSNTPVHEYTHIWDAYTQRTNPELWEKGKAILQQTHLWQEVVNDPNYAEIADDEDLVLSEVHSRICGAMAEKVLERIATQDGEIAKDRAIDWDKETWDYIESELLPTNEQRAEFTRNGGSVLDLKEFLATPMQDFMNGRLIGKEMNVERVEVETDSPAVNYELDKLKDAGIPVSANEKDLKETLAWLNEVNIALEMLDEEPIPIQLAENEKSVPGTTKGGLRRTLPDNIIKLENRQDEVTEKLQELKNNCDKNQYDAKGFLTLLQKELFSNDDITKSGYFINNIDKDWYKFRLSDHRAIISDNQSEKTLEESVVIKFCDHNGRAKGKARLVEFTYLPENFTKEKQMEILQGIQDWIKTGEFTGQNYDGCFISNAEMLRRTAQKAQKMVEQPTTEIAEEKTQTNDFVDALRENETLQEIAQEQTVQEMAVEKATNLTREELDYVNSSEFIEKFGDWKKARRLEKLKAADSLNVDESIIVNNVDITDRVNFLRGNYSKENLKELQSIATNIGREILKTYREQQHIDDFTNPKFMNKDTGKEFFFQNMSIKEVRHHNIFQKGHIEAISSIPKIIENGIYIGEEDNQDKRNPSLKKIYYFACGIKIVGEDYTCKAVFTLNDKNELFYDQSLSTIEKGRFVDIVNEKNKPGAVNPQQKGWDSNELYERNLNPFDYYDKRLINICQVPQMPFLDENLEPTKEAIQAVKEGRLYLNRGGQTEKMVELPNSEISEEKTQTNDFVDTLRESDKNIEETIKLNRPRRITTTPGHYIDLDYNENGKVYHQKESTGREIWRDFDENGKLTHYRDSHDVEKWYDENEREIHAVYPKEGYEEWHEYDDNGVETYYENSDGEKRGEKKQIPIQDMLRESDKAIEEATNGMGHDPTDGLPPEFEPPMDNAEMEMKGGTGKEEFEIAEPEGQVELIIPDSIRTAIYESEATEAVKTEYGDSYIMKSQEIYANEICSALEKFSQENSADWNIEAHDKTAIYHLMAVAEIGSASREESVEKIKEYFSTDIYASEKEQLGKMFGKIIETKTDNGYGFNFSTKQQKIEMSEKEQAVDEKAQKAAAMKETLEKMGIKDGKVPEFAMFTQSGLKAYKDMSISEWNPKDQTFTLSKYEDGIAVEKAVVTARTLKELMSQPRIEMAQTFNENTSIYEKMLAKQYTDFFEVRENTANNFRHNFAVNCRQTLSTPVDAIKTASELIKKMPVEERRKVKQLLNGLGEKGQSVNEKLVDMYKEALKDVPPNEHYLAQKRALETTRYVLPMFDTMTTNGQQVDKGFNLKIGDTINNVSFKVDKIFDTGKEKLLMDCKVVSATKEGNSVTLMDSAGGYHDVPRDNFLKQYAKQQKQEQKQDRHQKNIMRLDIER